jgi:hypothetical protein
LQATSLYLQVQAHNKIHHVPYVVTPLNQTPIFEWWVYIYIYIYISVCVRVKNHPNITLVLNYLEVSGNRLPSLYGDSLKGKRKRKRKKSSLISCRFCISTQFWNLKQQSLWFIIVANKVRQIPFQSNGQIYMWSLKYSQ